MKLDQRSTTILAAMALAIIAIVVIAGAVVLIVNPSNLSFHDYLTDLSILGTGLVASFTAALVTWRSRSGKAEPEPAEIELAPVEPATPPAAEAD
jgi:hypothetical protein